MNCDQSKQLFADYWSQSLMDADEVALETHLAGCEVCRGELDRLGRLWRELEVLPSLDFQGEPSARLRGRFYETLSAYRQGLESAPSPRKFQPGKWLAGLWPRQIGWQVGLSFGLLILGIGAGYGLRSTGSRQGPTEVAELRAEVNNMRQLVALSLLQQQSASERLRGVSFAYRVEPSDSEVLAALLQTVNHDPNVNVRLAAVDALHPFAAAPATREAVIQALPRQTTPLVQVALIDLLVDLREKQAEPELRQLADMASDPGVRQRAQWALERLQ